METHNLCNNGCHRCHPARHGASRSQTYSTISSHPSRCCNPRRLASERTLSRLWLPRARCRGPRGKQQWQKLSKCSLKRSNEDVKTYRSTFRADSIGATQKMVYEFRNVTMRTGAHLAPPLERNLRPVERGDVGRGVLLRAPIGARQGLSLGRGGPQGGPLLLSG